MATTCSWESIDVHLLQVLHALLTECSVSNAARRLNQSQPAVSTALRRLRDITGDQLLVRSRNGMTPTERGMALLEPVKVALAQIEAIGLQQIRFDPMKSRRTFNIATPDYLNAILIGNIVARLRRLAPNSQVVLHSFGPDYDYAKALESGELDTVIGNWPQPPEHLRLAPLFDDDVVCLMRRSHPLAGRTLSVDDYLNAEHLVPTPYAVGQRGVIDMQLARERLKRNVVASVPYFNLVPYVLLQNDIIFSAPRIFAEYCCSLGELCFSESPLDFPKMRFYLLWHDRAHHSEECRWFRDQIIEVIREKTEAPAAAGTRVPAHVATPATV
ncbi:MAG TPA: LysR substrate-binding domain-containing protein [Rhodocyclaceae bacterium]|uniref:LysR substrate-binding domain-containing protein n=1 Tax=Zoogloea sp. TaxID=49181 RepID=UPI002B710248|nr:LysR substrate-binding domain-containing protein [Zoogloea sp.]HMY48400.1 LysR substrate-binding domain-containing protein [Rhodocyclaceae bacterium]HNH14929.1 LysR substrate-binding domain-containing protein [Zoogloea sp.]HNI81411.1 LysR substrate-binding domain-containing protein [Rhodocyclaceae bacterium]